MNKGLLSRLWRLAALPALLAFIVIATQGERLEAQDPPPNNEATGTPTITGTPRVGEVLWVDISTIADADGLENAEFQFQIVADDDISTSVAELRALSFANYYIIRPYDAGLQIGFRLSFEDDAGNDESLEYVWSSAVAAVVPAPPENLSASLANSGDLNLSWTAPSHEFTTNDTDGVGDGGTDITGYKVQWKLASGSWANAGDVTEENVTGTTHAVTALSTSNTYTVRVLAVNAIGDGDPSTEVTVSAANVNVGPVVSGRSHPRLSETNRPPKVTTYTASDPESDGISWSLSGADSDAFTIEGGELAFKVPKDFENPGDADGNNTYEIVVMASDGHNLASKKVRVIMWDIDEVPVIAGPSTVEYAEDGTGDVVTFTATDPEGSTSTWDSLAGTDAADFQFANGTLTFAQAPDIENPADSDGDNVYHVTVQASAGRPKGGRTGTPAGAGTLDVTITVTTDKSPTIDSVTPGDRAIDIEWTAPTSSSLGTITSYDLRNIRTDASSKAAANWTVVTGIWSSGTLEYTLNPTGTRLVNGVSYDVQVRAVVGTTQQPWSVSAAATPRTTPGAPATPTVTGGNGSLTVEWSKPASDGGDDITSYDLRSIKTSEDETMDANWDVETGVWSFGDLEGELTGLDTGTQYDVQVRAVNDAGAGAWSGTRVGRTRPGAPAIDSVTGVEKGLTVAWSAPTTDGDVAVTSYDLRYVKTSYDETYEANWTIRTGVWTSGDLTATVTGLEVGTQYDVQVRAVNAAGGGAWSPTLMGTTVLSDDATLSALTLSGVRLTPTFNSGTTSYTPSVGYTVEETTVTPTTTNENATIEYFDGNNTSLGTGASVAVDLAEGENTVKVEITAQNGVATETYTITVTREPEDMSLTPPASDPVAPFPSTAIYTIRFQGRWTTAVTPDGLPGGAHFSRLIGGVHNADVTFLESGETASQGIESMAEVGGTSRLRGEVNTARNADPRTALSVIEGTTSFIGRTATRTLSNRTLTTEFPRVTLTTMIAPSHDWFVGVSGLPLLNTSGLWLRSHEVDLFPWDAGTEEGDDFSLSPSVDTTPRGVITSIHGTGKFTTERIASLTFTLQSVRTERSLVENTPAGVDIGEPVAAVAGSGTVTYTLGGTDAAMFDLVSSTGQLRTKAGVTYDSDVKSTRTVTITATDTEGSIVTTVDIAIENIEEPPVISGSAEVTVNEGHTGTVATYTKRDPEGEATNWGRFGETAALTGNDAGAFEFDKDTGGLTFAASPDFEDGGGRYQITLNANDGSLNGALDIVVTVTNIEETGSLTLGAQRGVNGELLEATLTDPDIVSTQTWKWQRSSSTAGPWADIASTNASSYTPGADDVNQYLRAHVTYTDGSGTDEVTLTAATSYRTANDSSTNEPPVPPDPLPQIDDVPENARAGRNVVRVVFTDPESERLIYSLDSDEFAINSSTGQITVKQGDALDYETNPSYSVDVIAADPFGADATATLTIGISNVNEAPEAVDDAPSRFDEDTSVTIDVLANDTDPENDDLTVTSVTRPSEGSATVNSDGTITYTPNANYHGSDSFTYRARDTGNLNSNVATVALTIDSVNDDPTFPSATMERRVSESADPGTEVGAPVTATDVDEGDTLTYRLSGTDAGSFDIGRDSGQITVGAGVTFDIATRDTYTVTVTATDSGTPPRSVSVDVTIAVSTGPVGPVIIGGGGGGGGGEGASPSTVDFEWTVKHDIEALDAGNDTPTGMWSDSTTLWLVDNPDGAGDAVYAYDASTGERIKDREFALDERNRAPRGIWSDGKGVVWVSDSGRDLLFAYDLATGDRLEDRDIELGEGNRDPRGIWSDGTTMWVLNRNPSLFAYDLASGDLLGEYALDTRNGDPYGIWSDGVTVWISDHGEKDLLAYRLPARQEVGTAGEDASLERVRDEDFTNLSSASNNSPRGIWSDGDVMYVADESDDRVYTYNIPDAIDARLASLTLSGIDIGAFDPDQTDYEGTPDAGTTKTTVSAEAVQRRTGVAITPPDGDEKAVGHQVALDGVTEIIVTVMSADGSRTRVYRVTFEPTVTELALSPTWTSFEWPGTDGTAIGEAGLPEEVVVVYSWDETTGSWLGYFPGLTDVPGLNTLALFSSGTTYWVAAEEDVVWTVSPGGGANAEIVAGAADP